MSANLLGVKRNQKIIIKINMCDLKTPETGAVTHPAFLRELIVRLKKIYPENGIMVAESDATVVMADEFFKWIGYEKALQGLGVEFVNLATVEAEEKEIVGFLFKSLPLPKILKHNYLISLAKLKTNVTSVVTFSLKNQYVFVRGLAKSRYHSHVHHAIVDANLLRKPDFAIVDGILGQGGPKAPAFGVPIRAERIIFGKDPVAVDSYCSRLISIRPGLVPHIVLAQKTGLGSMKYRLFTDCPKSRVDFEASILNLFLFKMASKVQRLIQASLRRPVQ